MLVQKVSFVWVPKHLEMQEKTASKSFPSVMTSTLTSEGFWGSEVAMVFCLYSRVGFLGKEMWFAVCDTRCEAGLVVLTVGGRLTWRDLPFLLDNRAVVFLRRHIHREYHGL